MNLTTKQKQVNWEKCIDTLLGKDSPCMECLVKVTCSKSFAGNTACEKLARRLERKINENKS
jgi:hypothetical protein